LKLLAVEKRLRCIGNRISSEALFRASRPFGSIA